MMSEPDDPPSAYLCEPCDKDGIGQAAWGEDTAGQFVCKQHHIEDYDLNPPAEAFSRMLAGLPPKGAPRER